QYTAMVLAGDYFWNPRADEIADLPYTAEDEFAARWSPERVERRAQSGFAAELPANLPLTAGKDDSGWLGYGAEHDLAAFPTGDVRLAGYRFRIADSATSLASPMLPSRALPQSIVLRLPDPRADTEQRAAAQTSE